MSTQPKINDGGPATDISARDYFAAQAMSSLLGMESMKFVFKHEGQPMFNACGREEAYDTVAKMAYVQADAMLKARQ